MSFSLIRRFFSGVSTTNMSAALKEKTESLIKDNAVMVFSKSYCPYCKATKKTLDNAGAKYTVYELNEESASLPSVI